MSIYDAILEGIDSKRSSFGTLEDYLQALKSDVRFLRSAYRKKVVSVPYHEESIQSAYLLTYFPHYYQLIEKILREKQPPSLLNSDHVSLVFLGGGPGSEVYGSLKYILVNNVNIKKVDINILDVNAFSWNYSHRIVKEHLIQSLPRCLDVQIEWKAFQVDLIDSHELALHNALFNNADLVVVQNCINEIDPKSFDLLKCSLRTVFECMSVDCAMLLIDLTQSVRTRISKIEKDLSSSFSVGDVFSTLSNTSPSRMISINSRPSLMVTKNLLNGDDNLIPRKNLVYDYSLIFKKPTSLPIDFAESGIAALYRPLEKFDLESHNEKTFVGLDFGTSVSVCSLASISQGNLKVKSIPIKQKGPNGKVYANPLIPSAMGVYKRQFMVGRYAYDYKSELVEGENSWYRFKSKLGGLKSEHYTNSVLGQSDHYKISNAYDSLCVYLKYINDRIREYVINEGLSEDIYYSISIPAELPDFKKNELRKALIESGIDYYHEDFVFEPIAALLSAIFHKDVHISLGDKNKKILIMDAGAGTFDVSILKVTRSGGQFESQILALNRIDDIGGDYVDHLIASEFKSDHSISNLQYYCELLKIKMCQGLPMDSKHVLPDKAIGDTLERVQIDSSEMLELSYHELSGYMQDYWNKVLNTLDVSLEEAGISKDDLDEVIVSGGGGRNPYLRSYAKSYFNKSRIVVPDNIQEQVSSGNAIHCLVSNTYGKSLMSTKISGDIRIVSSIPSNKGFKKGTVVPSTEIEISRNDLIDNQLIVEIGFRKEHFIYTVDEEFIRGFLWLTQDQGLKFEVLQLDRTKFIEPIINQININYEMDDRGGSSRG